MRVLVNLYRLLWLALLCLVIWLVVDQITAFNAGFWMVVSTLYIRWVWSHSNGVIYRA